MIRFDAGAMTWLAALKGAIQTYSAIQLFLRSFDDDAETLETVLNLTMFSSVDVELDPLVECYPRTEIYFSQSFPQKMSISNVVETFQMKTRETHRAPRETTQVLLLHYSWFPQTVVGMFGDSSMIPSLSILGRSLQVVRYPHNYIRTCRDISLFLRDTSRRDTSHHIANQDPYGECDRGYGLQGSANV